jgi:endo-1,4-beta-xylanase
MPRAAPPPEAVPDLKVNLPVFAGALAARRGAAHSHFIVLSRRQTLSLAAGAFGALASDALRQSSRAAGAGVPYGACVRLEPFRNEPDYRAALQAHCQQLTPEGGLFWDYLRPTRDQYQFDFADAVQAFADTNEMTMRGHTLVWYGAMPAWTKSIYGARGAEQEMAAHIERVVSRFRGKIKTWHVVNEPLDDVKRGAPGLRPNVWLEELGERYIDLAFTTAHRVDPDAELLLNEYEIESLDGGKSRNKREAFLKLIRDLLGRGVPLHGVGLQGHLKGQYAIDRDGLYDFVAEVRSLGLSVHVTELDVIDDQLPGPNAVRDALVAARALDFLEPIFAAARPAVLASWGVTDRYSWVPIWYKRKDGLPNRPLPFDADYQPKPLWRVIEYFCGKLG